jgi:hypothetical protein
MPTPVPPKKDDPKKEEAKPWMMEHFSCDEM